MANSANFSTSCVTTSSVQVKDFRANFKGFFDHHPIFVENHFLEVVVFDLTIPPGVTNTGVTLFSFRNVLLEWQRPMELDVEDMQVKSKGDSEAKEENPTMLIHSRFSGHTCCLLDVA